MGATFDEAAIQVVLRAVQGNLRLCLNLCYASLIAACLHHQRICTVSHGWTLSFWHVKRMF